MELLVPNQVLGTKLTMVMGVVTHQAQVLVVVVVLEAVIQTEVVVLQALVVQL